MANNTERMRIAAQLVAGTGGIGGGGGPQPPGKGTVSERGGELNAAKAIGDQIDQSAGAGGIGGTLGDGGLAAVEWVAAVPGPAAAMPATASCS